MGWLQDGPVFNAVLQWEARLKSNSAVVDAIGAKHRGQPNIRQRIIGAGNDGKKLLPVCFGPAWAA